MENNNVYKRLQEEMEQLDDNMVRTIEYRDSNDDALIPVQLMVMDNYRAILRARIAKYEKELKFIEAVYKDEY